MQCNLRVPSLPCACQSWTCKYTLILKGLIGDRLDGIGSPYKHGHPFQTFTAIGVWETAYCCSWALADIGWGTFLVSNYNNNLILWSRKFARCASKIPGLWVKKNYTVLWNYHEHYNCHKIIFEHNFGAGSLSQRNSVKQWVFSAFIVSISDTN